MNKITQHFTLAEMTATDHKEFKGGLVLMATENKAKLEALCWHLEAIRAIIQSPMAITSGIRSKELNKVIGGSAKSQHCLIEAADFIPQNKSAILAFNDIYKSGYPFGQLILEKRGIGYLIHFGIGVKRETLYSPKLGKYEAYDISKLGV